MIEAGIDNLLRTNSAINALVFQRVWPLTLPEEPTYPCMTYQFVGGQQQRGLDSTGLQKRRLQIDCFADTQSGGYGTATELRDTVMRQLNGFAGALSDGTFLQLADLIQLIDFYDDEAACFRAGAEFYLYFNLAA